MTVFRPSRDRAGECGLPVNVVTRDGAGDGAIAGDSPELQAFIDAWPSLSDDLKANILAMVREAGG